MKHFVDFESFFCFFLDRVLQSLGVKVSLDPSAPPLELVDGLMGSCKFEDERGSDLIALRFGLGLFELGLRPCEPLGNAIGCCKLEAEYDSAF